MVPINLFESVALCPAFAVHFHKRSIPHPKIILVCCFLLTTTTMTRLFLTHHFWRMKGHQFDWLSQLLDWLMMTFDWKNFHQDARKKQNHHNFPFSWGLQEWKKVVRLAV
jgi:L-asparagine transporter-like permease